MKKSFLLAFLILVNYHFVEAQNLKEVYMQNPEIQLVADDTYAVGNDWNTIFDSYYDVVYGNSVGYKKKLVVMDDGSAIVSHAYRNQYSLFDKNGKFVKNISIKDKNGKAPAKFRPVEGIINGYFYTQPDNMGKMYLFGADGVIVKEFVFDYSVSKMLTLDNNKMAVKGSTSWSDKYRIFVAIIDIETGKEKIIWDYFEENIPDSKDKGDDIIIGSKWSSMYRKNIGIAKIDNQLLVAQPLSGEIIVYDFEGNLKSEKQKQWADKYISVEEQKEYLREVIKVIENQDTTKFHAKYNKEMSQRVKELRKELETIDKPVLAPAFSNLIQDSDGNLLFFEYIETEGDNKFNVYVYNNDGVLCRSGFKSKDYDLSIMPSRLVFHDGYLYGIQNIKSAEGVPTRLVRFKLK